MNPEYPIHVVREALRLCLWLSGPALLAGLAVGFIVSVFQAVTHIQEMTLSFVPKIITVFLVLMLLLPWMVRTLVSFTETLLRNINFYVG